MTRGRGTLVIFLTFLAAIGGVWLGRQVFPASHPPGSALHELLHEGLELDARQRGQIDILEQRFALRRTSLELELRADNARLADAIEIEHGNGPKVAAAVDASHEAMGRLQKETLSHVFAMRALLRPHQAAKFDRAVVQALTDDKR